MKHTKEPWEVHLIDRGIMIASSQVSGYIIESRIARGYDNAIANARRIVACVNACCDVESEKLTIGYVRELKDKLQDANKLLSILANVYNPLIMKYSYKQSVELLEQRLDDWRTYDRVE
jgi:hypothetical protein